MRGELALSSEGSVEGFLRFQTGPKRIVDVRSMACRRNSLHNSGNFCNESGTHVLVKKPTLDYDGIRLVGGGGDDDDDVCC